MRLEWIGETLKLCLNQRVCDVDKELFLFFVGSNTDEQDLSKKAAVICQDVKASSSVKSLQKGTLKLNLGKMNIIFIGVNLCFSCKTFTVV